MAMMMVVVYNNQNWENRTETNKVVGVYRCLRGGEKDKTLNVINMCKKQKQKQQL